LEQIIDLGHKLRLVDGEHDVFGDGSVVCLPTHGHTPGDQSLRLRLDSGEVVLAADARYFCQTLRERRLPRNMYHREAMLASLDRLEALEQGGARIFFGHDPEFWQTVPQAPTPHRMTPTVRSCSTSTTTEKRHRLATARFRERLYPVEQARVGAAERDAAP
jgi:glyoxylase-like metal-dependent hydrolase (beta-lactamase superfamily II)